MKKFDIKMILGLVLIGISIVWVIYDGIKLLNSKEYITTSDDLY